MDFKSYSQKDIPDGEKPKQTQENPGQGTQMNEKDVRRAINYFGKMPNDQLMRELSRHLTAKKAQGREGEVKNIIERIKPLLNEEQRRRLAEIMRNFE